MWRLLILVSFTWAIPVEAQQPLDPDYGSDQIRSVGVQGTGVSYLDQGEGEIILFYHPGGGIYHWQWMIEAIASEYRVIVNGPLPVLGAPFGADSLISFLEEMEIGAVHLLAHSFGGRQAMTLVTQRPELLRSLILVEPAGAADIAGVHAQQANFQAGGHACDVPNALRGRIQIDDFACALQVQINEPGFLKRAPPELVQSLIESTGESPPLPEDWADFMPPICEALGSIDVPVLFIRGELTPDLIQKNLDGYEQCLPPHDSAIIEASSHYPHVYNPDAMSAVLLEFLPR